ncbi:MAG: DNA starvation/stationary phase protection protein [Pedobacter sp.]|nr:MAG: DNA starvation/stationary phase protection protein [Pedobacter sp.]
MKPNIGIKEEHRAKVAQSLSKILADEAVLYQKTRNAHWNVEGPDFHSMHLFFESQYEQLAEIVDSVAERIRSIGHYAPGTMKEFLDLTHLIEKFSGKNDSQNYIKSLLADHESILTHMRENIDNYMTALHDAGTSDYVTGLMETHEKIAWMLRAHLV